MDGRPLLLGVPARCHHRVSWGGPSADHVAKHLCPPMVFEEGLLKRDRYIKIREAPMITFSLLPCLIYILIPATVSIGHDFISFCVRMSRGFLFYFHPVALSLADTSSKYHILGE